MQEAPAQEGGGVAETLTAVDAQLSKIAQFAGQSPQMPEEAKAAFASALEAFRAGLEIVTGAAGHGAQGPAAVAPEQGGAQGAVPMTPAGVKR